MKKFILAFVITAVAGAASARTVRGEDMGREAEISPREMAKLVARDLQARAQIENVLIQAVEEKCGAIRLTSDGRRDMQLSFVDERGLELKSLEANLENGGMASVAASDFIRCN